MNEKQKKYVATVIVIALAIAAVAVGGYSWGLSIINFTIIVNPLQGNAPLNTAISGFFGTGGPKAITLIVDGKSIGNTFSDGSGFYSTHYIFAISGQHTVQTVHFAENDIGRPLEYFSQVITVSVSGSAPTHQLNVQSLGAGYTVPSGLTSYSVGQLVTITATAEAGSAFDHWVEDGQVLSQASSVLTITMDVDHSVSAVFSERVSSQFYLTTSISPLGSGSLNQSTAQFTSGTIVSVEAFPASGGSFNQWVLDGSSAGVNRVITVTMSRDHTLQALFTVPLTNNTGTFYTLTIYTSGPGTVSTSNITVATGDVLTVKATGNFEYWVLDGENVTPYPDQLANIIVVTMNADHTLVAVFSNEVWWNSPYLFLGLVFGVPIILLLAIVAVRRRRKSK